MGLLIAFILGTVVSFIASIPVGAVNMAIVTATLNKGRKSAFFIGLGAVLAEIIYCLIPLFGFGYLIEENKVVLHGMYWIAIPVLIIIGLWTISNRNRAAVKGMRQKGKANSGNEFFYGFSLCVSNPMVFFFWSQITATFFSLELVTHEAASMGSFLLGVPTGTLILYAGIIAVAYKQRRRISLRARAMINLIVGLIFILLGFYLIVDYFRKFLMEEGYVNGDQSSVGLPHLPGNQLNSLFKSGQLTTYNDFSAREIAV